jgi:hypothetical protein
MAYSDDFTLANNTSFQNQVLMSMVKAAVAISSEAANAKINVGTKRNSLANAVLNNPSQYVTRFAFACVETGLTGTPIDSSVDIAVSSVWNGIAGVTPYDSN